MTNLERMKAAAKNKPAPAPKPQPAAKTASPTSPTASTPSPSPAKPKPSKTPFEFRRGRLPDGSRFDVKYDAAKQTWAGLLYIPAPAGEDNGKVFEASAGAVFKLLGTLDDLYRAWVNEKKVDATPSPAVT